MAGEIYLGPCACNVCFNTPTGDFGISDPLRIRLQVQPTSNANGPFLKINPPRWNVRIDSISSDATSITVTVRFPVAGTYEGGWGILYEQGGNSYPTSVTPTLPNGANYYLVGKTFTVTFTFDPRIHFGGQIVIGTISFLRLG